MIRRKQVDDMYLHMSIKCRFASLSAGSPSTINGKNDGTPHVHILHHATNTCLVNAHYHHIPAGTLYFTRATS